MTERERLDPDTSLWDWLASDLRFYRERAGLSGTEFGKIIGVVRSTVSNLESGRLRLKEDQAAMLDRHFGTNGHFLRLLRYARAGHDPDWFRQYAQYEGQAVSIKVYQGQSLPIIVQTEDYARAIFAAADAPDIDTAVAARMARRDDLLGKRHPPLVWILLDEEVVDRPVGGWEVMRRQLEHLLALAALPHVSIRVVPRSGGAHVGLDGTLQIIRLDKRDIAYVGALGGGRLVEGPSEVRKFEVMYDRIGAKALPEEASQALIARLMEKTGHDGGLAEEQS